MGAAQVKIQINIMKLAESFSDLEQKLRRQDCGIFLCADQTSDWVRRTGPCACLSNIHSATEAESLQKAKNWQNWEKKWIKSLKSNSEATSKNRMSKLWATAPSLNTWQTFENQKPFSMENLLSCTHFLHFFWLTISQIFVANTFIFRSLYKDAVGGRDLRFSLSKEMFEIARSEATVPPL